MLTTSGEGLHVIATGATGENRGSAGDSAMALRFEGRRTISLGCSLEELARAINGEVLRGDPRKMIGPVATDSRHMYPGDTFLALKGENHDGSDFLDEAVEKGAEVLITSAPEKIRCDAAQCAVVKVGHTHRALLGLASWHKSRSGFRTICITGSCGKTATKELVSAIYRRCFNVMNTYENFNNFIGVPITILNATRKHSWAVLELGMNRPGEIGALSRVARPDIALVTNVLPAHLEGLGSVQGVAREKLSIFEPLSGDKTAVVNLDDPHIVRFADSIDCKKVGFTLEGLHHGGIDKLVRLISWRPSGTGIEFEVETVGSNVEAQGVYRFFCAMPGVGNLQNLMAAIAVGVAGGIPLEVMKDAVSTVKSVPGRLYLTRLGGWIIVDDTYNANPASMKNALSTLAFWSDAPFRCAILGDMLELGPGAPEFHREIGRFAALTGLSMLVAVGRYALDIMEGALQSGMSKEKVMTFDHIDALCQWLSSNAKDAFPGSAWILIKGSRGMKMEKAIQAMRG